MAKKYLIRCNLSGVWVEAEFVNDDPSIPLRGTFRIRGRRLGFWNGGRLGCGDLANLGVPEGSKLERPSSPTLMLFDVAEIHEMTEEAIEATAKVESWTD